MKKSLIFDLDGTLWDSREVITKAWNHVFKDNNIDLIISKDDLNNIMGMTSNEVKNSFFKNIDNVDFILKSCEEEEVIFIKKLGGEIYTNTINTLKELSKDYDLYIVSNCQKGYIEAFLEYYKLNDLFMDFECSGNTGLNKEKNIKMIIDRNNLSNSIYIGDTYTDYISSKNNNIRFIYSKYGFGVFEYDDYINDIVELIDKVKEKS